MRRRFIFIAGVLAFILAFSLGAVDAVTPSTNDINREQGWAHVNVVSRDIGEITLEFVSTRNFLSCFEYRTDGDTSQIISENNYNGDITDGLYPFFCVSNETRIETIQADEYVEIRMVFGAETDERFDWTRFDVLTEETKADILTGSGVPGKGLENAPGLNKPFNPNSRAGEKAGKK
ncbi:MAG: hypothetical protein ACQEP5_00005 [Actinomycetota bacterium]